MGQPAKIDTRNGIISGVVSRKDPAVEAARAEGVWPFPAPTTTPAASTTTSGIIAPPNSATWWAPSSTNIRH